MKKIILLSLLIVGCDVFKKDVRGCTDESACSYDETATEDNESCEYPQDFDWCNCYGNVLDDCGVCGGDNTSCSWTELSAEVEEINNISLSWDAVNSSSGRESTTR